MTHKRTWTLALLGGLLAVGPVAAQDAAFLPPVGKPTEATRQRQVYEDVEVLRRILAGNLLNLEIGANLHESCVQCHGGSSNAANRQQFFRPLNLDLMGTLPEDTALFLLRHAKLPVGSVQAPDVEGVYLEGQGVVYTVTLPPPARKAASTSAPPPAKSLSEWERVRRQVRDDKETAGGEPPAQREAGLEDLLLKVLAENGRHFTTLGESESLTVVVTFRERRRPATARGGSSGPPTGLWGPRPSSGGFSSSSTTTGDASGGGSNTASRTSEGPSGGGGGGGPGPASSGRDYELLAELHLKQGKYAEAVDAYTAAVQQYRLLAQRSPWGADAAQNVQDQEEFTKKFKALYSGMAQALLAAGKVDEASRLLEKVRSADFKVSVLPAAPALPSKLIVSAPRKLLDQVGAGKVSKEEFKKAARVEHLTFPADEKQIGGKREK